MKNPISWIMAKVTGQDYTSIQQERRFRKAEWQTVKEEARQAAWDERKKQNIKTQRYVEKLKGQRERERMRQAPDTEGIPFPVYAFARTVNEVEKAAKSLR